MCTNYECCCSALWTPCLLQASVWRSCLVFMATIWAGPSIVHVAAESNGSWGWVIWMPFGRKPATQYNLFVLRLCLWSSFLEWSEIYQRTLLCERLLRGSFMIITSLRADHGRYLLGRQYSHAWVIISSSLIFDVTNFWEYIISASHTVSWRYKGQYTVSLHLQDWQSWLCSLFHSTKNLFCYICADHKRQDHQLVKHSQQWWTANLFRARSIRRLLTEDPLLCCGTHRIFRHSYCILHNLSDFSWTHYRKEHPTHGLCRRCIRDILARPVEWVLQAWRSNISRQLSSPKLLVLDYCLYIQYTGGIYPIH